MLIKAGVQSDVLDRACEADSDLAVFWWLKEPSAKPVMGRLSLGILTHE